MLDTVKTAIENLPYIEFGDYFHRYVLSVQDMNIDGEMAFFVKHNFLNVVSVDRLIDIEHRSMSANG